MPTLIHRRVALAREGKNPAVIGRMSSGWLVACDEQVLEGYCILLADPVVGSINDLNGIDRVDFLMDTVRVGDALLKVTGAYRINYETLCNTDQALHTHIIPRYQSEPEEKRKGPVMCVYKREEARKFDPEKDKEFLWKMREELKDCLVLA